MEQPRALERVRQNGDLGWPVLLIRQHPKTIHLPQLNFHSERPPELAIETPDLLEMRPAP